ncbi:MAG: 4Fe-4S binding protein, partial [Chloroflexi bacterium]|nr:4Fe-4S binding protein [Chloroflexota bacterium]
VAGRQQGYLVHYIGLKYGVGLFSSHSFIESSLFKNVKGLSSTFWTAPIRECPANALEMGDYPVLNKHKCVHCYHCATICPEQAILCPTYKVESMAKFNVKLLGHEQPQNAIYLSPPAGAVGPNDQPVYT